MKSRTTFSLALLGAFLFGSLCFTPIAKAVEAFAVTTCAAASSACTGGKNTSSGSGVVGSSTNGNGIVAQTKYVSKSGTNYKSGLLGQDLSTSGKFDAGVTGTSTRGTGVLGTSSSMIGVNGLSSTNTGVWGQVSGGSAQPTGVVGVDTSSNIAGAGVAGQTKVGSGVVGSTTGSRSSTQAILGLAPNGGYVFVGAGSGNATVATLDNQGNLAVAGVIYTGGSCANCGAARQESYSTTAATPTIEDSGEAQLNGGAAYVHLDPSFAAGIDPRQGYFVLVTPEAETRGLYVAQRTLSGFIVRENFNGRSNGPFAYRIVAHPYGVHAPRLPRVQVRTVPQLVRQPQQVELPGGSL